jgi:hypothetical protein
LDREMNELYKTFEELGKACAAMYELVIRHNERIEELETQVNFLENTIEDSRIC